jgi:hypothetical protein
MAFHTFSSGLANGLISGGRDPQAKVRARGGQRICWPLSAAGRCLLAIQQM